jgi:hypothetical protein
MSVEGDICAYVRGRKNKRRAVKIAAEMFSKPEERIMSILWVNHLVNEYGEFIEPIRLTGLEERAQ